MSVREQAPAAVHCRGQRNTCVLQDDAQGAGLTLGCKRCCICWNATWTQEPRTVTGRARLMGSAKEAVGTVGERRAGDN